MFHAPVVCLLPGQLTRSLQGACRSVRLRGRAVTLQRAAVQHRYWQTKFLIVLIGFPALPALSRRSAVSRTAATLGSFFDAPFMREAHHAINHHRRDRNRDPILIAGAHAATRTKAQHASPISPGPGPAPMSGASSRRRPVPDDALEPDLARTRKGLGAVALQMLDELDSGFRPPQVDNPIRASASLILGSGLGYSYHAQNGGGC